MKLHKILKIVAAILSLVGALLLVMIISKGDTVIDAAYKSGGDTGIVDNMAYVAYVTFGLILASIVASITSAGASCLSGSTLHADNKTRVKINGDFNNNFTVD